MIDVIGFLDLAWRGVGPGLGSKGKNGLLNLAREE